LIFVSPGILKRQIEEEKNISLSGAQTHESTILEQYIFRAEIEK
jgi:hypothetical protein